MITLTQITETVIDKQLNKELWRDTLKVLAREAPLTTRRNVNFQHIDIVEKETSDGLLTYAGLYNLKRDTILTSRKYLENICSVANNKNCCGLSEDEKYAFFSHIDFVRHELTHAYLEKEIFKLLISRMGIKPAYNFGDLCDNITEEELEIWYKSKPFIEGVAYGLTNQNVPDLKYQKNPVDVETAEYVYNAWGACSVDEIRMAARQTIRRAYTEKRTDFLHVLKEEIEKPNAGLNWLVGNN